MVWSLRLAIAVWSAGLGGHSLAAPKESCTTFEACTKAGKKALSEGKKDAAVEAFADACKLNPSSCNFRTAYESAVKSGKVSQKKTSAKGEAKQKARDDALARIETYDDQAARKAETVDLSTPKSAFLACREALRTTKFGVLVKCFSKRNLKKLEPGYVMMWQMSMVDACMGFDWPVKSVDEAGGTTYVKLDKPSGECSRIRMTKEPDGWKFDET